MSDPLRWTARLRMMRLPGSVGLSTVGAVERRTDMNDARIALCAAMGVDLDDIHPSAGHNMSRDSYARSRESWVDHITMFGYSEFYDGPPLLRAMSNWTEWNPEYTDGDDWLKAGREAHYARQDEIGKPCDRTSCDLHGALDGP